MRRSGPLQIRKCRLYCIIALHNFHHSKCKAINQKVVFSFIPINDRSFTKPFNFESHFPNLVPRAFCLFLSYYQTKKQGRNKRPWERGCHFPRNERICNRNLSLTILFPGRNVFKVSKITSEQLLFELYLTLFCSL